mgnify:CR=1 FL=1
MPTYPVKNLKTGETKEIQMSMIEYSQWRKDNPDWDKDWNAELQMSEKLEKFMINFARHIPDGMMCYIKHRKLPVLK